MSVVNMCDPFLCRVCHIKYKWHLGQNKKISKLPAMICVEWSK